MEKCRAKFLNLPTADNRNLVLYIPTPPACAVWLEKKATVHSRIADLLVIHIRLSVTQSKPIESIVMAAIEGKWWSASGG